MKITEYIKWFDSLDSTSTRLAADKMSVPSGTVYASIFQTAGKGQRGNSWESAPGENLTFSILIKYEPGQIPASKQHLISEATTLGIVKYLNGKGLSVKIKWPNDIYAGDSKICGMLFENSVADNSLVSSIIGIGINLNQTKFVSNAPNPISVSNLTGKKYDIKAELPIAIKEILGQINNIDDSIENRFLDNLYRKGEWHEYIDCTCESRFKGRIIGTDSVFRLIVEKEDGSHNHFAFKEIKYII